MGSASRPQVRTGISRRAKRASKARAGKAAPYLLSEPLFRGSLVRHRRRVDRSNLPLVLMLVTPNARPAGDSATMWRAITEAIAAATRETDVVGWLEHETVMGVILTDLDDFDSARRQELETRLLRALTLRLDARTVGTVSIQFHVHHASGETVQAEGLLPAEPLLLQLSPTSRRGRLFRAVKRAIDLTGSMTLLIALAPLLLVIAVAVKLTSRGPVFFKQVRVGQMMKPFKIVKFRTMKVAADHAIHHQFVSQFIQAGASSRQAPVDQVFKITNDPRVTAVGRVLRKTSLDELPQLWNVLCGQMSLVGPRPPIPYEVEQYQTWHCRRVLEAKPGITGLWQVTGRSRTTFDEMVRLDIRYAKTCSLLNDLKILLATPAAVIAGKGAC